MSDSSAYQEQQMAGMNWTTAVEWFSTALYLYLMFAIWSSRNSNYKSPFYQIFLMIGVYDVLFFVLNQLKPMYPESGAWRTILALGTKMTRDAHTYLDVALSLNRFTVIVFPVDHNRIWRPDNLRKVFYLVVVLMVVFQIYTPIICILYGWKDEQLGYSQIYMYDAWHRFYYAVHYFSFTMTCLVLNIITLYKVKSASLNCHWSHMIFSVASTLIALPMLTYQILLSYATFIQDEEFYKTVFSTMSAWVSIFAGYYQPYWLLILSHEARIECVNLIARLPYFRRFVKIRQGNVVSISTNKTHSLRTMQSNSRNRSSRQKDTQNCETYDARSTTTVPRISITMPSTFIAVSPA